MGELEDLSITWKGFLSCTGNPAGEFQNKKGEVIAYSSYDYISKVTSLANPEQRAYFEKQKRS